MINVSRDITGTDLLTLEDAKAWMRVDGTADDALITSLITQSRDLIEEYCSRSLANATISIIASARLSMKLPYAPVDAITSVKDKETGEDITYEWDGLVLSMTQSVYNTFEVIYTAVVTALPTGLMLGWKEVVLWLYENRGDTSSIGNMLNQNANLQIYRNKIWI